MEPSPDIAELAITAYGIGEHKTVLAPVTWHRRIQALEAVTSYGPSYQRRVTDTLDSLSHKVRTGYLDLAEADLKYCERVADLRQADGPEGGVSSL